MDWADLGPTKSDILFWARPGPEDRAGPGPTWPSNKTGGGNYFSPHSPACRTLFVLHAGNKTKRHNKGGRRITWCGGGGVSLVCRLRWWCCGGGRWRCRGSRTAVPNNGYCFERTAVLLFFSSFLPVSSFSLLSLCFSPFFFPSLSSLRLFFFPLFFFVFCPLSCLCSPVFFLFSLLSVLSSFGSPSFFFLPVSVFLFYIYRSEKALGPSLVRLGSGFRGGWSATTRDSNAPLPCFRQGEWPVGQWLWSVVQGVGLRVGEACGLEREEMRLKKKKNQRKPFFFPPVLHVQGRKKEEQCRSKRHHSVFFFFLFFT